MVRNVNLLNCPAGCTAETASSELGAIMVHGGWHVLEEIEA